MARDARIVIMIDEKIKERLIEMADQMGITLSGLGSFILGQYVKQQDYILKPMTDQFLEQMLEMAKGMLEDQAPGEANPLRVEKGM